MFSYSITLLPARNFQKPKKLHESFNEKLITTQLETGERAFVAGSNGCVEEVKARDARGGAGNRANTISLEIMARANIFFYPHSYDMAN